MLLLKNKMFGSSLFKKSKNGNLHEVLLLAFPMFLSMSFDTFMTFVDRLFLAKLSPEMMNAALAGGTAQMMIMTFFSGMISYSTAQVAQYFGAKQFFNCSKVVFQAFLVALVSVPLVLCFKPFACWMFQLSEVSQVQMQAEILYLQVLLYGACFVLFRGVLISFFSGIGKTNIVMVAAFIGMLVNVILNYFLIFGIWIFPRLEILGAAYGTIAGNAVTCLILLCKYLGKPVREKFRLSFAFHKGIFLTLVKKGLPSGLEMFLCMLALNVTVLLLQGLGDFVATASSIMFSWDMVSYVPLLGLEVACTSIAGRYIGAKDGAGLLRSIRSALFIGFLYSLLIIFFFAGIPEILVNVFRPDTPSSIFNEAKDLTIHMLRVSCIYVIAQVGVVVFGGAIRGSGDTFSVMVVTILINWLNVLQVFLLGYVFEVDAIWCWCGVVFGFTIAPIVLYLLFKTDRWRKFMKRDLVQ